MLRSLTNHGAVQRLLQRGSVFLKSDPARLTMNLRAPLAKSRISLASVVAISAAFALSLTSAPAARSQEKEKTSMALSELTAVGTRTYHLLPTKSVCTVVFDSPVHTC